MKHPKTPSRIHQPLVAIAPAALAQAIGGVENSQERTNGNGTAERHPSPDDYRTISDGTAQRHP